MNFVISNLDLVFMTDRIGIRYFSKVLGSGPSPAASATLPPNLLIVGNRAEVTRGNAIRLNKNKLVQNIEVKSRVTDLGGICTGRFRSLPWKKFGSRFFTWTLALKINSNPHPK